MLIAGLVSGLAFGVLLARAFGITTNEQIGLRTQANAGIRRSLANALRAMLVLGPLSIMVFQLSDMLGLGGGQLPDILAGMLLIGAGVGGGPAVIEHLLLRLMLYRQGNIPWNYARFLDYCAQIGLLRKVGSGYLFAHRMLLEYFARRADA